MKIDKAREQTDKILKEMERDIGRVYKTNPALLRIRKKLNAYLDDVQKQVEPEYTAYKNETDEKKKRELKKIYGDKVKELTLQNKRYKKLVDEFTTVLAETNQSALDIVNDSMVSIYTLNYNQVAEGCEKAGIKVV